jgi:predicted TPR repeat methyltransferase
VKEQPDAAAGHFVLGYHYLVVGDKAAAVDQLREVTRVQPADKVAAALLKSLTNGAAPADAPPEPGR